MDLDFECLKYCDYRAAELSIILETDDLANIEFESVNFKETLPVNHHIVLFSEIERALSKPWIFQKLPGSTSKKNKPPESADADIELVLKELSLFYVCAYYILHLEKTLNGDVQKQRTDLYSRAKSFFEAKKRYCESHNSAAFTDLLAPAQECRKDLGSPLTKYLIFTSSLTNIGQYIINRQLETTLASDPNLSDIDRFWNKRLRNAKGKDLLITEQKLNDLKDFFDRKLYINGKGEISSECIKSIRSGKFEVPKDFSSYRDAIIQLIERIYNKRTQSDQGLPCDDILSFLRPPLRQPASLEEYEKLLCILIVSAEESLIRQLPPFDSCLSTVERSLANYCIVIYLTSNGKDWANCKIAREITFNCLNYLLTSTPPFMQELSEGLTQIQDDLRTRIFLSREGKTLEAFSDKKAVKQFGKRLKEYLNHLLKAGEKTISITQQDLADALGITQQAISKIINGKNDSIDLDTFLKIIRTSGLGESYFTNQSNNPGKSVNGLIKPLVKFPKPVPKD